MKTVELVRDGMIVAGAALIVAGLWQIWRPLGLMALGLLLVALPIVWELDAASGDDLTFQFTPVSGNPAAARGSSAAHDE